MKTKINLFFLIQLLSISIIAQEFQLPIVAESNGNLDTIIIGFDKEASVEIDSQFGEIDITTIPFDSVFEIRAGQIDLNELDCDGNFLVNNLDLVTYMSKIDFNPKTCEGTPDNPTSNGLAPISSLFFRSQDLPVTLHWDASLLQMECTIESLMTDWHPGGWFDAGCGSLAVPPLNLASVDSVLITDQSGIFVVDTFGDTLTMIHVALLSDIMINTSNILNQSIDIYPNPTNGMVQIEISADMNITSIKAFNSSGQLIKVSNNAESIDLTNSPNGIYILKINTKEGVLTRKVLKN